MFSVVVMSDDMSTERQQNSDFSFLPPKKVGNVNKDRVFTTSIPAGQYLRLESEAVERGTTPYKLAGLIISAYLSGEFSNLDRAG